MAVFVNHPSKGRATIHARVFGSQPTDRCRYCDAPLQGAQIHASSAGRWGISVDVHCAICHKRVLNTIYALPPRAA